MSHVAEKDRKEKVNDLFVEHFSPKLLIHLLVKAAAMQAASLTIMSKLDFFLLLT